MTRLGLRLNIFSKSGGILPLETTGIESNSLFFFKIEDPGMPTNESFEIVFIRSAVREVKATTLVFLILVVNKSVSLKKTFARTLMFNPLKNNEINKNSLIITII